MIVHHHLIIVAKVSKKPDEITCPDICSFLSDLVSEIKMNKIFEPIAIDGKFGFTGVVGIVTSHIAFHYYDFDQTLHFDVYSCKAYNIEKVLKFVDAYWNIVSADVIFLKRDKGLEITRYKYSNEKLHRILDE